MIIVHQELKMRSEIRSGRASSHFFSPASRRARALFSQSSKAWSALLVAALLVSGCRDRGAGASGDGDEVQVGGTAVIAGSNDLDAANGLVTGERYTKEILRHVLFTTLVTYDSALSYQPYLARSWEMQGDTGVVFHLRDDVYWHDSVRTTAYDVAFTFDRAKDPATAFSDADYFTHWNTALVVDSFTIRFRFTPHPDPLASWVFTPIMPRHHLESVPPAELRTARFNKNPVGNGPFRFVEYRPNDRWIFAANENFPEELGGRPNLDRLIWRIIPERTSAINELETGAVDFVVNAGAEHVQRLDSLPDIRAIIRPSRLYAAIFWNGKRAPFGDARVRRALTMAIDRQEILAALRAGYGEPAVGPISATHWAADRSLRPLSFDTAAAAALLDEAGIRDRNGDGTRELADGSAFRFDLYIPANNEFNRDMATMIQADLAAVGVRMDLAPREFATLIADLSSPERRYDAALMGWQSDFRINLRDVFHSSAMEGPFQSASYSNPEVDSIIDLTDTIVDREEARPHWYRLQAILREEQPWTFLYYYPDLMAARERLQGLDMDVRGLFTNVAEWWVRSPAPTAADSAQPDSAQ